MPALYKVVAYFLCAFAAVKHIKQAKKGKNLFNIDQFNLLQIKSICTLFSK